MGSTPLLQESPSKSDSGPGLRSPSLLQRLVSRPEFGPLVLMIAEIVIFAALSGTFLSTGNISNLLAFTPELGIIAVGMTMLMTSGEFDLSVGSVFGFAPIIMWSLYNAGTTSLEVGFANGWFVTILKIPSFLVTLGMLLVVRGTSLYITDGFPQGRWEADSPLMDILVGQFHIGDLRIFASLIWFILIAIVLGYVLTQSKVGNWILASGGNPNAARARGVRVTRTKIGLFILTAVLAGLAGIISSIRVESANPNAGTGYELEMLAMVVIGGTALTGGRGTIVGTVLGVIILRLMRNGIVMIGVPGLAYNIFIGAIILGMMSLHSWLERRHQAGT